MTKKQLALILGALVIAGTYWLLTSSPLNSQRLEIAYKVVPQRSAAGRGSGFRMNPGRGGNTNRTLIGRLATNIASAGRRGAGSGGTPRRVAAVPDTDPLFFSFNKWLTLDWVKVYPVSELETNRELPHVVWEVVATTNPVPTKGMYYGNAPEPLGLRLAVEGFDAEPLEPGVKYRMFLSANSGSIKAHATTAPSITP